MDEDLLGYREVFEDELVLTGVDEVYTPRLDIIKEVLGVNIRIR